MPSRVLFACAVSAAILCAQPQPPIRFWADADKIEADLQSMRTLEFAIGERAQTSALRHDLSSSLKRSLWPDASIQLRAAARPSRITGADGLRTRSR
jgi:hypothetical protein